MVRGIKVAMTATVAGLAVWALPATANAADTSTYHPSSESRNFSASAGGFTADNESDGLCLPVLLCPVVSNSHEPAGGAGGEGYLETSVISLLGVAGESRAIWTGPSFTYRGADGKEPTKVWLKISRNSDLAGLLSVVGNEADYSVEIVDDASGVATRVIDRESLRPTQGWTTSGRVAVDEEELEIGRSYHFRIVSRFIYGANVIPGGAVGYDDLSLTAQRSAADDGGGGGGGAKPGGGRAILDGRNLFITLKCYSVQKRGKCFSRATALKSKKGKRYTFPIQRKVKSKKGKVVRARIRFRFRSELEQRRSIVLRSVLRTNRNGKKQAVKYERLKLIKRGN
jgi:hypothetical protein